jgi:hypothetical protein
MSVITDVPGESVLRALMEGYCDAWNREDLEAILDSWHVPNFSYRDRNVEVFLDAKANRDDVAGWLAVNRSEGPATWELSILSVTELGLTSALITSRWVFRRPDGSAVWDFVDSHHLCQLDGRWKFLDRTLHEFDDSA